MRSPVTGYRVRKPVPERHIGRLQARVAKGQTLEEAAEALGIPFWLAKAVFVRSGLPLPKAGKVAPWAPKTRRAPVVKTADRAAQDLAVVIALRVYAHELAALSGVRGPVPVSMGYWNARRDPSQHPAAAAVAARFGSWTAACEAAGVPARRKS